MNEKRGVRCHIAARSHEQPQPDTLQCDQHNHQAVDDLLHQTPPEGRTGHSDSSQLLRGGWYDDCKILWSWACAIVRHAFEAPATHAPRSHPSNCRRHPGESTRPAGDSELSQGWTKAEQTKDGEATLQHMLVERARNGLESMHMTIQHPACNTSPLATAWKLMGTCCPVGHKDQKSWHAGTTQAPQQQHEGLFLMHALFSPL